MKDSIIAILFICSIGFAACKKNTPPVFGPYTMQSVFINMAVTPLVVTMNANSGGTFLGNSGTRYIFPPFSLERDSVSINGNVQIQVAEYLRRSDMIFSGVLPYSNGSPFISGGAFYINITQDGNPVVIARPAHYEVVMPQLKTPPPGLQLFFGRPDDTVATNQVNWQMNTDTSLGSITYGDSLIIYSDSTHYCCPGKYLPSSSYQTFSLKVTAPITTFSDTIMAYALYDSVNVAWQMAGSHNHIITETMVPNTPVHFVVFTVIDGYFYAGILGVTPVAGNNYSVYLTKTSPAALKNRIDAL